MPEIGESQLGGQILIESIAGRERPSEVRRARRLRIVRRAIFI
jgi:hypothetical protein